jgi:hypothetical protein
MLENGSDGAMARDLIGIVRQCFVCLMGMAEDESFNGAIVKENIAFKGKAFNANEQLTFYEAYDTWNLWKPERSSYGACFERSPANAH